MNSNKQPKPAPKSKPERKRPLVDEQEDDRLFEQLWHGEVDGETFDGDPADLW